MPLVSHLLVVEFCLMVHQWAQLDVYSCRSWCIGGEAVLGGREGYCSEFHRWHLLQVNGHTFSLCGHKRIGVRSVCMRCSKYVLLRLLLPPLGLPFVAPMVSWHLKVLCTPIWQLLV
uniref:Secreted protein n=1 Tax=Trypanosoma vivax (strain Y486) TaxID=1055687 RepID=G0TXC7_TRYVY|nr:hypothetical protein TVY486_0604080 [Trypanosoma vivax Y486]